MNVRHVGDSSRNAQQGILDGQSEIPRSPIVAKPVADLGKDQAPPKTYEAPKPDPKVEPKPRATRTPAKPQLRAASRLPLDTAQPQPQPKVDRPAPKPQPQPKVDRPAPPPRNKPAATPRGAADTSSSEPKANKRKGKD